MRRRIKGALSLHGECVISFEPFKERDAKGLSLMASSLRRFQQFHLARRASSFSEARACHLGAWLGSIMLGRHGNQKES